MSPRSLFLVGPNSVKTVHGMLLLSNNVMLQEDLIKIVPVEEDLFLISTVACINKKTLPPRFLRACEGYLISQTGPLSEDDVFIFLKKNQIQNKVSS